MHLPAILGSWGHPPDRPAWGALIAAGVAFGVALGVGGGRSLRARRRSEPLSTRATVALLACAATLLSLGYIAFYLRGGARIVDATSYFLQARALSEGHFAWRVPEPSASFRGRFLLFHDGEIAGIFPPGYPLLLSLGFAIGAPYVIGPLLAGAIVVATWWLGRELAREAGMDARAARVVALTAACLSVACGALRYHTADTMAHGACALAFTLALLAALRARRDALPWFFLLAGIPLGFVVATRFASALALGAVVFWLALRARARTKALLACALGAIPGVLLLLIAQGASTGRPLGSTQAAYYATSDGPPGCFRYGFGAGIGCLVEHGDFVRARESHGGTEAAEANGGRDGENNSYGLVSALGVTARRLRMHTLDIANFEPLALLVLVPLAPFARTRRRAEGDERSGAPPGLGARAALALVGALVVAYAPFYFDGDYPGGGARFLADALPIEHALSALGIALLVARFSPARTGSTRTLVRASAFALACSLAGFAVHAAYDHEQLRTRDGGHPMFDPEVLADRFIGTSPKDGTPARPALVFFDTDHGFALAHDPEAAERAADALARHEKPSGMVMARLHNDDHDRLLFERLGRPPAWLYRFLPDSPDALAHPLAPHHETSAGEVQAWSPPAPSSGPDSWRFEAENEWPPLAQTGSAWAEPIWVTDTCASPAGAGRALAIHARGADGGTVVIALPIPRAGAWRVTPRILVDGEAEGAAGLALEVLGEDDEILAHWTPSETGGGGGAGARRTCIDAPSRVITVASDRALRLAIAIPAAQSAPAARPPGSPATSDDAAHMPALPPVALDRILLTPSSR